ncbi:hypothetical protein [Sporosarcina sp. FSL K6-3457]|uniref:hypothetical protein n=1 Tax=Sporosarcina sp. FSL K6-3457 TaxID=2978204 RepID=UPI0030F7B52A
MLLIIFMLIVISFLSTISYQLKLIVKHLDIKEKETVTVTVSNEEIEKELEDEWSK